MSPSSSLISSTDSLTPVNQSMEIISCKKTNKNAMGVLCTGWLDKTNPEKYFSASESKKRFAVLTHIALHWFRREEGYDLFGEETGQINITDISSVKYFDEDNDLLAPKNGNKTSRSSSEQKIPSSSFEVSTKSLTRRIFRAANEKECELWVNQINYAIRSRNLYRRLTISGIAMEGDFDEGNTDMENAEPIILAITLEKFVNPAENTFKDTNTFSVQDGSSEMIDQTLNEKKEIVLGKNLQYADTVKILNLHSKDTVHVLFSTGDSSSIKGYQLLNSAETHVSAESISFPTVQHKGTIMVAVSDHVGEKISLHNSKASKEVEGDKKRIGVFQVALVQVAVTLILTYFYFISYFDQYQNLFFVFLDSKKGRTIQLDSQIHNIFDNQCIIKSNEETLLISSEKYDVPSFSRMFMASVILLLPFISSFTLLTSMKSSIDNSTKDMKSKQSSDEIQAGRNPKNENLLIGDIHLSIDEFNFIANDDKDDFPDGAGMLLNEKMMEGHDRDNDFTDEEIPQRFVVGCFHDMVEARRRWALTRKWRREFGADTMLDEEHLYIDTIKDILPHFYCKSGYDGNPVYYERSGQCNIAKAKEVGMEKMIWHYVHTTEFIYQKIYTSENHKTITVFDVKGIGLKDLTGEPLEFIRKCINIMQDHYPERARAVLIVNTPSWFEWIWSLIKPFINEVSRKKIKIVSAKNTFECINEFVHENDIPTEYGGKLVCGEGGEDNCRWYSPEEVAYRNHVYATNKKYAEQRRLKEEMKQTNDFNNSD